MKVTKYTPCSKCGALHAMGVKHMETGKIQPIDVCLDCLFQKPDASKPLLTTSFPDEDTKAWLDSFSFTGTMLKDYHCSVNLEALTTALVEGEIPPKQIQS